MKDTSEEFLIAQVILYDDHSAFAELIKRHQSGMRNLLLKLVNFNNQDLADVSQETFIKVYKNLRTFRKESSFSTWLYRIAYRSFLDWNDKKKRYGNLKKSSAQVRLDQRTMEQAGDSKMDAETVISCLRPEEKIAFQLSFLQGFSHKEIAQVLECPIGTVKSYLLRGKQRIRNNFKIT